MESADAARDLVRAFRSYDLRWYSLQRPRRTGFRLSRTPPPGFGVAVRAEPQQCQLCERTGRDREATVEIRADGIVGPGSAAHYFLCAVHATEVTRIVVGDDSGLTAEAATDVACRGISAAARALTLDTGSAFDHMLYFEHDNDLETLRGRSGYVVGLATGTGLPSHQFALVDVGGSVTNRVHVPHGGPGRTLRCAESMLRVLPAGAALRGISSDGPLTRQVELVMSPVLQAAGATDGALLNRYVVACVFPGSCTRQHVD